MLDKETKDLTREEAKAMINSELKTWKKTPYIEEKILSYLSEGKTKKRAASLSGITEQTLYNWINKDPHFRTRVENHLGGTITLRAIDNVAEEVRLGDVDASKWWIKNTKHFDKRYDPQKNGGNVLEANVSTGVFEIVEPDNVVEALIGPTDLEEDDLIAALYEQDPDVSRASEDTETGTETQTGNSLEVSDIREV